MYNCRDKIYKSLLPHWTGIQGKEPGGCIQRETLGIEPYAGADYNLTLSHRWTPKSSFLPQ
jgi:hypothetical protein